LKLSGASVSEHGVNEALELRSQVMLWLEHVQVDQILAGSLSGLAGDER